MGHFFILGSAHISMIVQGTKVLAPGRFNGMVTLLTDGTALQAASTIRWINNVSGLKDLNIEVAVPFFKRDAINQMLIRDALELGVKAKVRSIMVDPPAQHVVAAQMDLKGSDGSLDIQVECSPLSRASFVLPKPSANYGIAIIDGRAPLSTLNQLLSTLKDSDFTTIVFFPRGENLQMISLLADDIDAVLVERVLESSEIYEDEEYPSESENEYDNNEKEPSLEPSDRYLTAEWVRDDQGQFHVIYISKKGSDEIEELVIPKDLPLEDLQIGHLAAMLSSSSELRGKSSLSLAVHIEAFNKDMSMAEMQDHAMHLSPQFETLADKALRDQLTGLSNRHQAERVLCDVKTGCIAMIDLDYFKPVNDVYGHDFGDDCLKFFARSVEAVIRPNDKVFRWGGEEFIIYLDASISEAVSVCERVGEKLKETLFVDLLEKSGLKPEENPRDHLTVSIGITSLEGKRNWVEALSEADVAVYQAKADGRDCISII